MESMNVLEEFEERYKQQEDDKVEEERNQSEIVTVQVYNVVIASCS